MKKIYFTLKNLLIQGYRILCVIKKFRHAVSAQKKPRKTKKYLSFAFICFFDHLDYLSTFSK